MSSDCTLDSKDTETLICSLNVPEVDAQIISRQVRLLVTVNRDGVDVVRMSIRVHFSTG